MAVLKTETTGGGTANTRTSVAGRVELPSSSSAGATSRLATSDPAGAQTWAQSLEPGSPSREDIVAQWLRNDPRDDAAWLEALERRGGLPTGDPDRR